MRIICALVIVLYASASAVAETDNRIVPGERINGYVLGMSVNEALAIAVAAFGTASVARDCTSAEEQKSGGHCVYRVWTDWIRKTVLGVEAHGPVGGERVAMILTDNSTYRTEEGVGPDSPLDRAVNAYGRPPVAGEGPTLGPLAAAVAFPVLGENGAWWPARGIGVAYGRESRRVHRVFVFVKQ